VLCLQYVFVPVARDRALVHGRDVGAVMLRRPQ
jgi:hypothetical protein